MTRRERLKAKREARLLKASYSIRYVVYGVLRFFIIGFILASVANLLFSYFFFTPKMHEIASENMELLVRYKVLQDRIAVTNDALGQIKHRNNAVYSPLFGVDTLCVAGIYADYPQEKYADLGDDRFSILMTDTWKYLDRLARQLYLQSVTLDRHQALARDKEKMALSIPAIIPVNAKELTGSIGTFGNRLHPIYKRYIMHKGIDLPARTGTPVYATGDGVVTLVNATGTGNIGYGKNLIIDHGFGYKTRYAHLSKLNIALGQEIKRGELIGEVGNTGGSVGSHLHYEIIFMGHHINPIGYFRRDMEQADFERIIESANDSVIYESDMGTNVD